MTWQRLTAPGPCPASQEAQNRPHAHSPALRHHRPQNTASASSKVLAATAGLLCHATGKPRATSQAAGPGDKQHVGDKERGWLRDRRCQMLQHHSPGHSTAMASAPTAAWAHLGSLLGTGLFRAVAPVQLSPAQLALVPSHHSLHLSKAQKWFLQDPAHSDPCLNH